MMAGDIASDRVGNNQKTWERDPKRARRGKAASIDGKHETSDFAREASGMNALVSHRTSLDRVENIQHSQSLRHLFSFGQLGTVKESEEHKKQGVKSKQPFTMLGDSRAKVQPVSQPLLYSEKVSFQPRIATPTGIQQDADRRKRKRPTSPLKVYVTNNIEHCKGVSAEGLKNEMDMGETNENVKGTNFAEMPPFEADDSTPRPEVFISALSDDFDLSFQAITALGEKFCRQTSIDSIEEEWCREDGVRDQMRRDFKLKRAHTLRDRKLTGSVSRA